MTADTETIREALEIGAAFATPEQLSAIQAALAALGRVEERAGTLAAVVDDLLDWHEAECGCDEPGNPSKCIADLPLHNTLVLAAALPPGSVAAGSEEERE